MFRVIIIGPLELSDLSSVRETMRVDDSMRVVALDGGIDHCMRVGLLPHFAVGDFDSVSPEGLAWVSDNRKKVGIVRLPREKDFSDLGAVFEYCQKFGFSSIDIYGCWGGRLDHQLAVIGQCARLASVTGALTPAPITLHRGDERIELHPAPTHFALDSGTHFSIIAPLGEAVVSIENAAYLASHLTLHPLSDHGISNFAHDSCAVAVHHGVAALFKR